MDKFGGILGASRYHTGCLKLARLETFTPWKLTNPTSQHMHTAPSPPHPCTHKHTAPEPTYKHILPGSSTDLSPETDFIVTMARAPVACLLLCPLMLEVVFLCPVACLVVTTSALPLPGQVVF